MAEMMVNLRVLRDLKPVLAELKANGVEIRRADASESYLISEWVGENINPNWKVVCEVALEQMPSTCFIALDKRTPNDSLDLSPENLLGFACYDVVKLGVFGPSGMREDEKDGSVSTALLLACLHAMAEENYAEAVIGWAGITEGYSGFA